MRLRLLVVLLCSIFTSAHAQTQQGVVKTKGRMVNGRHVPGTGLANATIIIKGGKTVLSDEDGTFSFAVTGKTFHILSVRKKNYQLVDADATMKTYHYSATPVYLVMETPDQQRKDKLAAERKLRLTLQRQLAQREEELKAQRAQNLLTQAEYRKAIGQLRHNKRDSEKLISDMAKEYAQTDYDQMDELNRRITDAILDGRLQEADSLLRTKGDIDSRIARNKRNRETVAREAEELNLRQQNLEQSEAGAQKEKEDIAQDCYKFYDRFKLSNQHDSAAHYIQLRADLDTTNAKWQFDAAYYCAKQNQHQAAVRYYERALAIRQQLAKETPQLYEPNVATTMNNLANLYKTVQRYDEGEAMYKGALEIYRRLATTDSLTYEPNIATTLNNLAILYRELRRFDESEAMYREALTIRQRMALDNPSYEPNVATTMNNLASLYKSLGRFDECEAMYKEALAVRQRLAQANPQDYEADVAGSLNNLASLYSNAKRYDESETMYREALATYQRLAATNPQAYEPDVALALNNIAILYEDTHRYAESDSMYREALAIRRRLAAANPQVYERDVARTLNNLAILYANTQRYAESETMYQEALAIRRRLAANNPYIFEQEVATTLSNMGWVFISQKKYAKAHEIFSEALTLWEQLRGADHPMSKQAKEAIEQLNRKMTEQKE